MAQEERRARDEGRPSVGAGVGPAANPPDEGRGHHPPVQPEAELAPGVMDQAKVEEIIEEFETEARTRKLAGPARTIIGALAIGLSLLSLYYAVATIQAQFYRPIFLALSLVLIFLYYPGLARWRGRVHPIDLLLGVLAVVMAGYVLWDYEELIFRFARPNTWDVVVGAMTILLVIEATRRTTGIVLPIVCVAFLLYAYLPQFVPLPQMISHRGYDVARIVGQQFISTEGIFGVPLDVASSFIILFTIYGAVLEYSGAGKFFIDFSFGATGRKPSGAGRTVTLASFLLGTVSGSGVATTVTLGSIAYPMMRRSGYDPNSAGAVLAAGGIGTILSPPVLGAAAFVIAEYLRVSYLEVLVMATVPTLLYYLAVFLMIEIDAKRLGTRAVTMDAPPIRTLLRKQGYHFTSLFIVIGLMAVGLTPIYAVFWSIVAGIALSFLDRQNALVPRRLGRALESGGLGVLGVVATTAAAGIIVGVTTQTGLGLKISGIIVQLAGGNLFLTLVYACVAVWVLGLAVPVTASYIIAAVMIAPALAQLGVPDFAAHLFIFYYAVLSEVTPPTALTPFAAAAITGGNPYKTTMLAWKYTLVAFIVPFMFTLDRAGEGLLLKGDPLNALAVTITAAIGVYALVQGVGGWLRQRTNPVERVLLVVGGIVLIYPAEWLSIWGVLIVVAAVVLHWLRTRNLTSTPATAT
ncbi:MAG: TRAP transporter fused permease subunit [Chloroflexota bacterium]|nr:TRAP transporter fused permease subunit [Chloroflexota bacterium]